MDTANKVIRRKSLGRVALIGSLYNAMRDTFCGTAILKAKFPNGSLSQIDIPNSELFYEYEDSYVEKFNKLDVEAELKLSVLAGLTTLEGSGKYLSDVKDSFRTVKGNLIYRMITVEENLNIYRDDVKACISTDGFSNTDATHVVIGIKWGAIVIASVECKNMNEDDKYQIEAALKSYFEKLSLSTSENDNVSAEKNQPNLMNYFSITFLGDAVPYNKKFPQSFDEAKKVMTELPSYVIKFNNGKGFPVEYILYPISGLAKLVLSTQNTIVNSMIRELNEEIVLKIEQVFDGLLKPKQRLNDLFNDAKSISNLIPDNIFDEINNHVQEFRLEEAKFRKEFAESLVKIRSGKSNIDELESIMKKFQKGILSKSSITAFIDRYRSVSTKADLVLAFKTKKVEHLDKNSTIEHILRRNSINNIYKLIDQDIVSINSSPVHSVNSNEKSIVADPKKCPEIKSPGRPVVHHIDGSLESNDYYNNNNIGSNLVKSDVSNLRTKPDPNEKMLPVSTKADLVLTLKAKNVEYLDKDSSIEHILRRNPKGHIYILIDEDIVDGNLSPVHMVFRDLYELNEKSSKFFVVDPKICPNIKGPGYPVIHHYVNGRLESNDYYNANKMLFTSNLIKFDPQPHLKPKNNPIKKARLLVPCPRVNCSTFCNWRCFNCQHDVEYGYNWHLYCGCGESSIGNCKFKCNGPDHNEGFVSFEFNTLTTLLPSEPPEEINILFLGETGVGKSTFLNAFVNYLRFDTLKEAKSGNMEVLISSKFTLTDEYYDTQTIKIGNDDSNEQVENVRMSSTQECNSYVFYAAENKLIRLIDTPGIGDTRGLDQDKKYFENILKYISYYRHINGICILLKPNNARLTVAFRFCIQELLSHLHRNAKDNIVFCFTNARGTFYRPGDTLPSLKKQLGDLKERSSVEIKANHDTLYCFDNESFRFLAAIKKGISFTGADEQNFAESWKKSVKESLRLMQYLLTRPPHAVKDTLSLNNSRNIVVLLSKPLAEIGQLIQANIKLIKEQQNEIKKYDKTIEELKENLYIQEINLEPVPLKYPRTVCTSISCVESLRIGQTNISKINYVTQCHDHCYCVKNVTPNEINSAALRECTAMGSDGKCKKCHCQWNKHMHITYENKQVITKIVDQNVELQISKKKSDQETKRAIIEEYQTRVNQLQTEQHTINEISLKFAQFLRQNAIATFNDAYADYLDDFINEEKIKKSSDPNRYDDEILEGLEATKRNYSEQIEVVKEAIKNNDPSMPTISPNDIAKLEQQLYNLPINGHTLKKIKDEAKHSQNSVFRYRENYYSGYSRSKDFISSTFAKIFR